MRFEDAKNGDVEAQQEIVLGNLGMVKSTASRYGWFEKLTKEEVLSAGAIGIYRAIKSFDPEKGKFSTILGFHLRKAFSDAYMSNREGWTRPKGVWTKLHSVSSLSAVTGRMREDDNDLPWNSYSTRQDRDDVYCPACGNEKDFLGSKLCGSCMRRKQRNGICQGCYRPLYARGCRTCKEN